MSLGEIGTGLNIQGSLTSLAQQQILGYVEDRIFGGDETPDGPPSLYEMLFAILFKAIAGVGPETVVDTGSAAMHLALSAIKLPERHHVIPIYMCGGKVQEKVWVSGQDHDDLHASLLALNLSINIAGKAYDVLGKRRRSKSDLPPLIKTAKSPYGREAIVAGLRGFYSTGGWIGTGAGEKTGQNMGAVLMREGMKFATANHTWPKCSR